MKRIIIALASLMVFSLVACYKESDYSNALDDSLYSIGVDKESILADGYSTAKIIVKIPIETGDSLSKITFKTSAGVFFDGGLKTLTLTAKKNSNDNYRTAEAVLKSSVNIEDAIVSVELFGVRKIVEVSFVKSYPDKIKINASSFAIKPVNSSAGEVSIDCAITKLQGFPSVGNVVNVIAYDSVFVNNIGLFRVYNNQSNESGKTGFVFVLGDSVANNLSSAYLGRLFIVSKAISNDNPNTIISDTVQLVSSR